MAKGWHLIERMWLHLPEERGQREREGEAHRKGGGKIVQIVARVAVASGGI